MKMELTLEPVGSLCEWGRAGDPSISDSVRERAGGGLQESKKEKMSGPCSSAAPAQGRTSPSTGRTSVLHSSSAQHLTLGQVPLGLGVPVDMPSGGLSALHSGRSERMAE